MKIRMEQISSGEEEAVIRYRNMTSEIEKAVKILTKEPGILMGKCGSEQYRIEPRDIYYFESVDEKLFSYTEDGEYQIMMTLSEAEHLLPGESFFRCNKSFLINVDKITSVKSVMGSRIDARLDNGEHIIISRRYAKEFRELLKGGAIDE